MIIPEFEAAMTPGIDSRDDVRGFVVGERLRLDKPE
jgi:hypothetical protein